ncbi:MAG: T9SS type A sorting domain-containing protein [Bacteroidota bacterium]
MKNIILLIAFNLLAVKGHCQNNAIFNGGNGDGWAKNNYQQPANNIFNGGNGDGWAKGIYAQPANNIFNGGIGDGWAYDTDSIILSVTENTFGSAFNVYPNPTAQKLNINLGKTYPIISVDIYNLTGQLVSTMQFENVSFITTEVEGKKGIYFVKLLAEDKTATIKVIKN